MGLKELASALILSQLVRHGGKVGQHCKYLRQNAERYVVHLSKLALEVVGQGPSGNTPTD
jgi:hypothetical protein